MDMILDNPMCKEITAIEMFELAEGEEILQCEEISPYEEEIYSLVKKITEKFPIVIQA